MPFFCVQPERQPLTERERDQAESLKRQGNDHMKDEEFDKAIDCYSRAIAIDGGNAVYYCNRYRYLCFVRLS